MDASRRVATASLPLARVFVEIADTLVEDFDLVEFLQLVTTRASELSGSHTAGLLLANDRDELRFMAASDEQVRQLETLQVTIRQGPCFDCFGTGAAVLAEDLGTAGPRWPRFAPEAVAGGVRAAHSFPLRLRQQVIGTLGMFSGRPGTIAPDVVGVVQGLADLATIGILQERAVRHQEALAAHLQGVLNSRVMIEQAKGILAQQRDVSIDRALAMLHAYCRSHGLRLSEVAHGLVREPSSFPALRGRSR